MCVCECAHMIVHMCMEGLPGLPCTILLKQSLTEHGTYQFYDARRIGFWGPSCLWLPSAGVTDNYFYRGVGDPNLEPWASLTESVSPVFLYFIEQRHNDELVWAGYREMSNSYVLEQWPHGFLVRILAPPSLIVTHISFRGFLSAEEHARVVDLEEVFSISSEWLWRCSLGVGVASS